jgi:hypothetical protein
MLIEKIAKSSVYSRTIVSAGIVFLVGMLGYIWAVEPQMNYLNAAQEYHRMVSSVELKVHNIRFENKAKKQQIEELKDEVIFLEKLFFDSATARDFFSGMEQIMSKHNCRIISLNALNENFGRGKTNIDPADGIYIQTYLLTFSAGYSDVMSLLETVDGYDQKVFIDELVMNKVAGSDSLHCKIKCSIYVVDKESADDE